MGRVQTASFLAMVCFAGAVNAQIVYNTNFNIVSFLDGFTNDGGGMDSSSGQVFSGFAEWSDNDTAQTFPNFPVPPGYTEAYGKADYTELKARVRVEDISILRQTAHSTTYDIFTITDPNMPQGTPGNAIWGYTWGGTGTVLANAVGNPSDEFVLATMLAIKHEALSQLPTTTLASDQINLGHGQTQSKVFLVNVPFNYGIPFGLRFRLMAVAKNDWTCMFTANSLNCFGGTLDFVEADFASTAVLGSITIPEGGSLEAESLTAYGAFLGAPIPIPPAFALLLSALIVLKRRISFV